MKLNLSRVAAHAQAVWPPAVPADRPLEPHSLARSATRDGLPPSLREARHANDPEAPETVGTRLRATLPVVPQMDRGGGSSSRGANAQAILETHLTGHFRQDRVREQHLGGVPPPSNGLCAGWTAVWMAVHKATPHVRAQNRLLALDSLEGAHHALIAQRSCVAHYDDLIKGNFKPSRLLVDATQNIDQMYGVVRGKELVKSTSSNTKLVARMSRVEGYASLTFERKTKGVGSAHEMSMYRHKDEDRITFFDSNRGELNLTTAELPRLVDGLRQRYGGESEKFKWALREVNVDDLGRHSPLAGLVSKARDNQAALDAELIALRASQP